MVNVSWFEVSKNHCEYLIIALEEATKSTMRCKHGCIIVNKNHIVSRGHNRYRGNGTTCEKKSIHAESDALDNCNRSALRNADLYVVRYDMHKKGTLYSEPCQNCRHIILKYMTKYGLRNAYYSTDIEF